MTGSDWLAGSQGDVTSLECYINSPLVSLCSALLLSAFARSTCTERSRDSLIQCRIRGCLSQPTIGQDLQDMTNEEEEACVSGPLCHHGRIVTIECVNT